MVTEQKKIDLALPRTWNQCTTEQLELIAAVMLEQLQRQDRYRPFSMRKVKIALFFAFAGIEVVDGPNPRVPVEEQYYTCRLRNDKGKRLLPWRKAHSETFSLYLWQINYWISPKAKTNNKASLEYISQGSGLFDWLDNDSGMFLTRFPYPELMRSKHLWQIGRKFCGPLADLDGFSWAQYRFATDTMQSYTQLSNSLLKMGELGTFSAEHMLKQAQNVDLAKSMFLASIFNAKTDFVDTNTGIVKHDYHYESNQCSDNAQYFRGFPDVQWQVIAFWWTGVMHSLSKRYPHVFKVQPVKKRTGHPHTPLELYTATVATMQKHAGLTEDDVNRQSYSLVLEHLERIAVENEEIEKTRRKR